MNNKLDKTMRNTYLIRKIFQQDMVFSSLFLCKNNKQVNGGKA